MPLISKMLPGGNASGQRHFTGSKKWHILLAARRNSMPALINASVKISPDLHARLKSLADLRNQPVHAIMRQALEAYVTREEKRAAFKKEGIEAWEEYQKTGLH